MKIKSFKSGILVLPLLFLAGCNGPVPEDNDDLLDKRQRRYSGMDSMFGDSLFTFGGDTKPAEGGSGIGVNQYLWRASLDTISFMPLRSVDPFGGVIITEWYTPPEIHNERLKVDILILDRQLRADGVRVSIHKQRIGRRGVWEDAFVDPESFKEFEEAILSRARQLKIADGNS